MAQAFWPIPDWGDGFGWRSALRLRSGQAFRRCDKAFLFLSALASAVLSHASLTAPLLPLLPTARSHSPAHPPPTQNTNNPSPPPHSHPDIPASSPTPHSPSPQPFPPHADTRCIHQDPRRRPAPTPDQ